MVLWLTSAMPNLVVYVPARVARALEAMGVSEDVQRRACKEVLVGLADGELAAGDLTEGGQARGGVASPGPTSRDGQANSRKVARTTPSSPAASSFRPDFKGGSKR